MANIRYQLFILKEKVLCEHKSSDDGRKVRRSRPHLPASCRRTPHADGHTKGSRALDVHKVPRIMAASQ